MASLQSWLDFCQRLYAKGVDVFSRADVPSTDQGPRDPRVVALTLLARTLGHARAVFLLLEHDNVVEARTITRSAYENLFWAAALVKQGTAFVDAIELDDITSRRKLAKSLLDWTNEQGEFAYNRVNLEAFRDRLWDEHGKTDSIILLQAAIDGGVGGGIVVYRELSNDAAHPSAASLSRHVATGSDDEAGPPFTLHGEPINDPTEAVETFELFASAVLGVIVAVNQAVGGIDEGERLESLAADFRRLSSSNKADRDRRQE